MTFRLPPLPDHWRRTRLDHEASVNARIGWKALTASEYVDEGFAFLSTPNIKGDTIDFANVNFINEFRYDESPELKLRAGDVLLAKDGSTLGITNVVRHLPRPATVNGSIAVLRPRRMEPRFLMYTIASDLVQGMIGAVKAGMGVPHLFQADIKKFPLPLPPLAEQRAIADYLDTETTRIDALIANKRRMVDLLDERDLALAYGMVVGLDESGPRKSSTNWLGTVPRAWPVASVSSQFEVVLGRMLNAERAAGSDQHPYVRNINVRWDTVDMTDTSTMSFTADDRKRLRLSVGDLLVNEGGAGIGRTAIWRGELEECYVQKAVLRLRPIAWTLPPWFVECMRVAVHLKVFLVEGNHATIPHVPAESLKAHRFPFPPAEVQQRLLTQLRSFRRNHEAARLRLVRQIELLAEHRQALITAAVTGGSVPA